MVFSHDTVYLDLVREILHDGAMRSDRTGVGTLGLFGRQMRFNLKKGFPLLTTKKMHFKSIVHELIWMIQGHTHVKPLQDAGVTIWDEWATPEQCARFGRQPGDLGPVYGHQWRNFGATKKEDGTYNNDGFDQLKWVVEEIEKNPNSRRLVVSGWNPLEATQVALPPCHTIFQFYVLENSLSCHLYQRSADIFLGVPFNIASYALLTHLIAKHVGLDVGEFVHSFGDVHLYSNHFQQAREQLLRTPFDSPEISLLSRDLFRVMPSDVKIEHYRHWPAIKAPVAV